MQTGVLYRSAAPDVSVPAATLHDVILTAAAARGDRPSLVDATSGRTVTYAQLADGIRRTAAGLAMRGFAKGDVLAIHAPNLPEWPIASYGAMAAGGVVTASSPLYTTDELTRQLRHAGARYVLTVPPLVPGVRAAAEAAGSEEVFTLGQAEGATPFAELLGADRSARPPLIDPGELAMLPYSSGTSGLPKGVLLSHRAIVTDLAQIRAAFPVEERSVVLLFVPMFHSFGQAVMGVGLTVGAQLVTLPRFELETFLSAIQRHRVTHVFAVPPVMLALAKHPAIDKFDLSSLEAVFSSAAPLGADIEQEVADRLGCHVGQGLGMTEAGPVISMPDFAAPRRGAAGKLVPNTQARIVDPESGRDLGPDETGELWVMGPQLFSGYKDDPEATAATLDEDGWLHTGDLARFDGDGYLHVTDRLKELIKVKGNQVPPAELEALLATHPHVADVAVVGRRDEQEGEIPVAYVVPRSDLDPEALMAWVAQRVAPHKRIRAVVVTDEIPRNPAGKTLRRMLRDRDVSRS